MTIEYFVEYDYDWFMYQNGLSDKKPEYKVGHILKANKHFGYSTIFKIENGIYHLVTDFGNIIHFSENEMNECDMVVTSFADDIIRHKLYQIQKIQSFLKDHLNYEERSNKKF